MANRNEVRVAVSPELKRRLKVRYEAVGVTETDYIRSLIIEDLKQTGVRIDDHSYRGEEPNDK